MSQIRANPPPGNRGELLLNVFEFGCVMDWRPTPAASGFLFTYAASILENANVYRYDFASGTATQLTHFTDRFARDFSLSPDGQFVVFELAPTWDSETADLWMMRQDGTEAELFVANGRQPSWSSREPQIPQYIYLPLAVR